MAIDPNKNLQHHATAAIASKLSNGSGKPPATASHDIGDFSEPEKIEPDVGASKDILRGELDGLVPIPAADGEALFHGKSRPQVLSKGDSEHDDHTPQGVSVRLEKTQVLDRYILIADDPELMSLLRKASINNTKGKGRSKLRDFVFTPQLTVFDRQNVETATSPFHGFFSLFWSVPCSYSIAFLT